MRYFDTVGMSGRQKFIMNMTAIAGMTIVFSLGLVKCSGFQLPLNRLKRFPTQNQNPYEIHSQPRGSGLLIHTV